VITKPFGMLHDMGGEDHGLPILRQIVDELLQLALIDWIQPREGLIENHQFRAMRHSREHLYFLGHAFGQRFHLSFREILEAIFFQ